MVARKCTNVSPTMVSYFAGTYGRHNVLLAVHRPHGNAICLAISSHTRLVINGIHTRLIFADDAVGLIY